MDNQTQTKPKPTTTMKALFMFDAHFSINNEMLATYDIGNIPSLTFGYTNGDDIEPAQIHRMVASIGHRLAKTQQPTTDENGDECDQCMTHHIDGELCNQSSCDHDYDILESIDGWVSCQWCGFERGLDADDFHVEYDPTDKDEY